MKKADLIKKMIKTNVGEKPTYGTDPNDPWSAKAGITEDTINETALLNRYLKSRGINPEFVSKDQKVAHSKTNQFKTWMVAHANDEIREGVSQEHTPTEKRSHVLKRALHVNKEIRVTDGHKQLHSEAVDKKDTITFDIPLLIRVLEFAREELKNDVNLHKMVERLIAMRGKGTLTMNQYGRIVKEEFDHLSEERIDEISKDLANRYMHSSISDRNKIDDRRMKLNTKQREQMRTQGSISLRRHKNITNLLAKSDKRSEGIGRALDRVTKEETEQLDEISPELQHRYFKARYAQHPQRKGTPKKVRQGMDKVINRALKRNTISTPGAEQDFKDQEAKRGIGHVRDHVEVEGTVVEGKEANYGGDYQQSVLNLKAKAEKKPVDMKSLAARMQASYAKDKMKKESLEPMAACNQPGDGANNPDDTVPGKKSTAKKVKLLLGGKKPVTEEMYDHEKEDKSTAPLGKKVKFQKPGVDAVTKEQPQAAAVLSGGKTLTGEPRDTIEIDPMMKMKKQSPNSQKSV